MREGLASRWVVVGLAFTLVAGCSSDSATDPGNQDQSGGDTGGETATLPAAPSDLALTPTCAGITLIWVDNANNETGFRVYRQHIGVEDSPTVLQTVPANAFTYTDASVQTMQIYIYKVHSFNASGESNLFTYASATAAGIPAAPTSLSAQWLGGTSLRLTWIDRSLNESGFEIRRSAQRCDIVADWTAYTPIQSVPAGQSEALTTIPSSQPTKYRFVVYAKNPCGYSGASNQAVTGCFPVARDARP